MSLAEKRDHEFVPVHKLLSESETSEMLEKMSLKKENLPKVSFEDPQIVKIGGKPNQVVKIYRKDNGHEYEYFRLII